jgi:hypothetical protein
MQKKFKLSSDGGDSGSKKYNRDCGGVWLILRLAEVWGQVVGFCWCVWQESGFSRREDVFTFNLLKRNFINFVLSMPFAK